jgi:hypothetical protein
LNTKGTREDGRRKMSEVSESTICPLPSFLFPQPLVVAFLVPSTLGRCSWNTKGTREDGRRKMSEVSESTILCPLPSFLFPQPLVVAFLFPQPLVVAFLFPQPFVVAFLVPSVLGCCSWNTKGKRKAGRSKISEVPESGRLSFPRA